MIITSKNSKNNTIDITDNDNNNDRNNNNNNNDDNGNHNDNNSNDNDHIDNNNKHLNRPLRPRQPASSEERPDGGRVFLPTKRKAS